MRDIEPAHPEHNFRNWDNGVKIFKLVPLH
jgi:hypothetical protein